MKVKIDRKGCISCAACWTTCPDFFEESPDDGKSQVAAAYRIEDKPGEGNSLNPLWRTFTISPQRRRVTEEF
jgi:ferredoxin